MDETRKRYIIAGILIGTVTVGLVVLARKTPREKWAETLRRIAGDAIDFVKEHYGASEPVKLVEKTLEKYDETGRETAVSRAFQEAVEKAHGEA